MTKITKLLTLALTLFLLLSLATPAMAAEGDVTVTVSIAEELEEHTFSAYQVFSGTYNATDETLGSVVFGSGISNEGNFLTALKQINIGTAEAPVTPFADCADAAAVAKVLGEHTSKVALAEQVAKIALSYLSETSTEITTSTTSIAIAPGYYLIVDTTEGLADANDAYNAALLQIADSITIGYKTDVPSVEKKVWENDSTKYGTDATYGEGYNDVADYNMGDPVPFHLIGVVPDMSRYTTYCYEFYDEMSTGLTPPNASDVKIYLSDDKIRDDNDDEITGSFTIEVPGQKITAKTDNLKAVNGGNIRKGQYIIVEYEAVLNQNAEVGLDGNWNEVYLKFSNKPDDSGMGKTPEDRVIVFTYELDVNKVNKDNQGLQDAQFVLFDSTKQKVAKVDGDSKVLSWVYLPTGKTESTMTENDWTDLNEDNPNANQG